MMADFDTTAILHRKNGVKWTFKTNRNYGDVRLIHETKRGNVYAIMSSVVFGMPFWVARLHITEGQPRRGAWCNADSQVKPVALELENGGRYEWPKGN
jgi:hypothetical protein